MKRVALLVIFFAILCDTSLAQPATADFSVASQYCVQENIIPKNLSINAISYQWDYCQGDLVMLPTVTSLGKINGQNTEGFDVVFDGSNWYGFVTGRDDNSITRLDFGASLTNTPTPVSLGNVGSVLSNPNGIKIVYSSGSWYGFVYGASSALMTRIDFGTQLNATGSSLSATVIITGSGTDYCGLDVVAEGNNWYIVYNKQNSVNIARLTSITATPTAGDMMTTGNIPAFDYLGDIRIVHYNGQWFGYTVAIGTPALFRLEFGSEIFSVPSYQNIMDASLSGLTPSGVDIGLDMGQEVLFVNTTQGSLVRYFLGSDLTASPVASANLGNFGMLNNLLKMRLVKSQTTWWGFTSSWNSSEIFKIAFPNPICSATVSTMTGFQPTNTYAAGGTATIGLRAYSDLFNFSEVQKDITINASQAPALSFTSQYVCATAPVLFAYQSPQSITSVAWDFGNGDTSSQTSPGETFNSAGTYTVSLKATASNLCTNTVQQTIQVFNPPSSDFTVPSPAIACTNQQYTFVNTSIFDTGSAPAWQWNVNGTPQSTSQNLTQAFASTTLQQIQLISSIPGCSAQKTQNFTIQQQGPIVSFATGNPCQGQVLQFTNNSSGSITGYAWNFGDGNTSTATNPQDAYSVIGNYTVTLTASNPLGCNNSTSQSITVHSTPQPAFSLGLPPFSCNGTPSQFADTTPLLTDSNLASWVWSFGDPANGSSSQQNPAYTYTNAGAYNVSLTVTTDFACSGMTQNTVTIQPSPVADFTNVPACVNQGTQFTDGSGPGIKSRVWQIGSSTFTIPDPVYVFGSAGTSSAHLTVTANNNCIAQLTKSIIIPVPQVPDFSATSTCAGKSAVFQDVTPAGGDPTVAWGWNFAGQAMGSGSTSQHVFPATGNFSVTMSDTAQSGCVYAVSKTISIITAPRAGFTTSTDAGGAPLLVQFTNTSSNATSYAWQFNDPANSVSSQTSPSFTFTEMGDYVVDLTALGAQGCSDIFSEIIHVVVPSVDAALDQLQLIQDNSTGQLQALFLIENKGNLPLTDPTIVLDISGGATIKQNLTLTLQPGQQVSQVLNYSLSPAGLAYLCLSVQEQGDVDAFNDKQCASLDNENVLLAPYPNPSSGLLNLDWIAASEGSAQILIFNSIGEKSLDRELTASSGGLNQIQLDVSNLHSGVYLVVFKYQGWQKTFRFIVN